MQSVALLCALVASATAFHLLDTVTPGGWPASSSCAYTRTAGCYENRLRIGVLTFATRGAHPASLPNAFIAQMYTLRHGYDFITERCAQSTVSNGSYTWDYDKGPKGISPAINWSKHLFILKHLPFYDAVLYVDSDMLFVDQAYRIEDFLDEHLPLTGTHTVAFGVNCMTKDFCWNGLPGLNAGAILVRNAPSAFALLREWAEAGEDGRCDFWRHTHPLEQQCFDLVLNRKYEALGTVKVADTLQWKGSDGTWLMHAFSGGGLALPGHIITRLAMRSFMYLLESEHPSLYSKARDFTREGMLTLGPPWLDKKNGQGLTHEEEQERLRAPPGPKWGWEHEND